MFNVNYSIGGVNTNRVVDQIYELVNFEPVPLLKHIKEQNPGSEFIHCPAFIEYVKNAFVIKSAYNLKILIDSENQRVSVKPHSINESEFNYDVIKPTLKSRGFNSGSLTLTLPPSIYFWSKKSCHIESMSMILDTKHDICQKAKVIPGTFDISRWFRHLDFTFQINENIKETIINRGDPLFAVRFVTKNNEKVSLMRVKFEDKHIALENSTVGLKRIFKEPKLENLYTIFDKIKKMTGVF
jgi:hypothetical protein